MKSIDCSRFERLSTLALFGELSRRERARFDAHMAGCPKCAAHLETLKRTAKAVDSLPLDSPSESVRDRILAEGARRRAAVPHPAWVHRLAPLAAAAAIVAAVVLWAPHGTIPPVSERAHVPVTAQAAWYDDGALELAALSDRLERAAGTGVDMTADSDLSMLDVASVSSLQSSFALGLTEDTLAGRINALKQDIVLLDTSTSVF